MLSLYDVLKLSDHHPKLLTVPFDAIVQFRRLAWHCKRDIMLTLPSWFDPAEPPPRLPECAALYLSDAIPLDVDLVYVCWEALRLDIWNAQSLEPATMRALHLPLGDKYGFTGNTIYPGIKGSYCVSPGCRRSVIPLAVPQQRRVILFTLEGVMPAYNVHLYCEKCKTNYHAEYYVHNKKRYYYPDRPCPYLQVSEHQFVSCDLAEFWAHSMLVAWTSASNCALMYNEKLRKLDKAAEHALQWPFVLDIHTDDVWNAVILSSLLRDFSERNEILVLPHSGDQKHRFTAAMQARNNRIRLFGQEELLHRCNKCVRYYTDADGTIYKTSFVVTDGVTLGRPCCAFRDRVCTTPLSNNRHRFCDEHLYLNVQCRVIGCTRTSRRGKKTCSDPCHSAAEAHHDVRGQSRYQLSQRYGKQFPSNAVDSSEIEPMVAHDEEEEILIDKRGRVLADDAVGETDAIKIRLQMGRKRTYCEQFIHAPCGMIVARDTFFNAESPSAVKELFERLYAAGGMPDHVGYDNNCHMSRLTKDDPFWSKVGLTVDVFHFKCKHSTSDTYCQQNCNPTAFPELLEGKDKWFFNSSVAEQNNNWLGNFGSIVREMLPVKYDFFLDEMVLRKNRRTKEKLKLAGHIPTYWDPALDM